jgi:hypothetical protein
MAQRASLRDHTSLAVEKRRSNRTVYILRKGVRAAQEGPRPPRVDGSERGGPDYRALEVGRRRANRLVLTVAG